MVLDIQKQDDGTFKVFACSTHGIQRRVIGTIYRVDDATALFAWKERNDGLQKQLDQVNAVLRCEMIESPSDHWQQGFNAGLFRVADALGMTDRTDGGRSHTLLGYLKALAEEALVVRGQHHKQWFLERIAEYVGINLGEVDYEPGIAP